MPRISVGDYSPIHLQYPVKRCRIHGAGVVMSVACRESELDSAMTPFAGDWQQYLVGRVVLDFA